LSHKNNRSISQIKSIEKEVVHDPLNQHMNRSVNVSRMALFNDPARKQLQQPILTITKSQSKKHNLQPISRVNQYYTLCTVKSNNLFSPLGQHKRQAAKSPAKIALPIAKTPKNPFSSAIGGTLTAVPAKVGDSEASKRRTYNCQFNRDLFDI